MRGEVLRLFRRSTHTQGERVLEKEGKEFNVELATWNFSTRKVII